MRLHSVLIMRRSELDPGLTSTFISSGDEFENASKLPDHSTGPDEMPYYTNLQSLQRFPPGPRVDISQRGREVSQVSEPKAKAVPDSRDNSHSAAVDSCSRQSSSISNPNAKDQCSRPDGIPASQFLAVPDGQRRGSFTQHERKSSHSPCHKPPPDNGINGRKGSVTSSPAAEKTVETQRENVLKPTSLAVKTEELSRALASEFAQCMSTSSMEEMQRLIKTRVLSLLNPKTLIPDISHKRNADDAGITSTSDPKRKRVACDLCPKTMERHCDLK